MAIAGYSLLLRKSGVSTGILTEPAALFPSGQSVVFRISDSTKRVIDANAAFHFKDGTTTIAYSSIANIDYLNGEVTFLTPLGAAASCSFSGSYLPITTASDTILETKSFKLSLSRDLLDRTVFTGTSTDFVRKRLPALQDWSLEATSIAQPPDLSSLATSQFNGTSMVVEVFFGDAASIPRFRGYSRIDNIDTSGQEDGLVETNLSFKSAAVNDLNSNTHATFSFKVTP